MKQQQVRPLEEVLQDPSANWDEIRSAIKGQAPACTNVAIMQALANEKSWATAAVATAIVMKEEQQQKQQKDECDEENNDNEKANDGCVLDNSSDLLGNSDNSGDTNEEADNVIEVLTARLPAANDSTDTLSSENETNNKRSFRRRRGRRRGSGVGTSFRGSGRRRANRRNSGNLSVAASINMMDFGFIENVLDLSESNKSGSDHNNLRGSGDFSEVSKSGFMGWKHQDDMSLGSSYTHDKSSEQDGSDKVSIVLSEGDADDLKEDFSNFVDSSGFLDWRHSAKRRASSRSSFGDDEDDEVEGFLDWQHSIRRRSSFIDTVDEVEDELSDSIDEWNIEDYDGDPEKSAHTLTSNYKHMSALSDRLDRLKMFGSTFGKHEVDPKDDITISDIKEALLNVRKEVGNDNKEQEQSTSRRPTICGVPNPANLLHLEATTKKTQTRRQTVIGSVASMLNVAKSETKNDGEIQEDNYLDSSSGSTSKRKKALDRRRRTIMDGIAPFVGMRKDQEEKVADIPTHDGRAAIRISREDGNVDIERECRKLYSYGLYSDLDCVSSENSHSK